MKILHILCLFALPFLGSSQAVQQDLGSDSKTNLGLGAGLDYGGFGGRLTFLPSQHVGVFGALGYNLAGLGYNFGAAFRIAPANRIVPVLYGMYGYNAVIVVTGSIEEKDIYYGPSFGFGIEMKGRNNPTNFLSLEVLLPLRPPEYQDRLDYLESIGVTFQNQPLPFTISIGYHFGL